MKLNLRNARVLATVIAGAVMFCVLAAWAVQAASRAVRARAAAPASMAAMLPQGALLTIESPDFARLLRSWNDSPEQKAWLASANFSVFSNSRLFGRLNDARSQFEAAASKGDRALGIDSDFLTDIAGRESIFAWYDVGRLEFLYVTRISPAQAAASSLLKQRAVFSPRQVAGRTFYLRRSVDPETNTTRTVAFAQVSVAGGNLLLLSTREDLMAGALQLLNAPAGASAGNSDSRERSLAQEPWYTEASAALPQGKTAPALHMVLNLERIVPLPAFRTYWVQQNISEMTQYRASAADLYRDGPQFREERVLLLKSPPGATNEADAGSLEALAPDNIGVYRAIATHDADVAVQALEEKLLGRFKLDEPAATSAPDPSLEVPSAGAITNLETYIDAPAPVSASFSNRALSQALTTTGLDAMLTCSSALPPATPAGLWVPIHSGVVLRATSPWKLETVLAGLQQSLRGNLTTANLGIEFHPVEAAGVALYALSGAKPLFVAVRGNLWLLADDQALLLEMLRRAGQVPAATGSPVLRVAGFDHSSQRAPFGRLTALVDGTNRAKGGAAADSTGGEEGSAPAFFSQNIRSLSDAFAGFSRQRFVERRDGSNFRQTVTYQ